MLLYRRVPTVTSLRLIRSVALPDSFVANLIVIPGFRHPRPCVRQIVLGLTDNRAPSGAMKSPGAAATRMRGALVIAFPLESFTAPTEANSTYPASPAFHPGHVR